MNRLCNKTRAQILHLLCEGQSIRAVTRITGASKNTVIKLLVDAGRACAKYQDRALRNLPCKRLQVDELWSFVYAKERTVTTAKAPVDAGDVWTWTAICADTKLMPSWFIGGRDREAAMIFMDDLAKRLAGRVQLTSDGHRPYIQAVEGAFGGDIDYAVLVKIYGPSASEGSRRYSPAECIGTVKNRIEGNPDPGHVSTSYVERNNLTIRMHSRRYTRLPNAFSKKVENHAHAFALHALYYNFVRIHKTHRMTPAMAAGVTDHLWEMADVVSMIEAWEVQTRS